MVESPAAGGLVVSGPVNVDGVAEEAADDGGVARARTAANGCSRWAESSSQGDSHDDEIWGGGSGDKERVEELCDGLQL